MPRGPLLLLMPLLLLGCGRRFTDADAQGIRHVMDTQVQAWDRGDIDAFMDGYSDSVCFISKRGRTCGKAAVTANYKHHYPDKAAMGDLRFADLEVIGAKEYSVEQCCVIAAESKGHMQACLQACGAR